MKELLHQARIIWNDNPLPQKNQYVAFRREFQTSGGGGRVALAADSNFLAYLNGREIGRGQFSDAPQDRTYTVFDTEFRPGCNVLEVLVYYCGGNFSTYAAGQAGLIGAIRCGNTAIVTDRRWHCAVQTGFRQGEYEKLTTQLGYVVCYDAARAIEFPLGAQPPGPEWRPAVELATGVEGYWRSLEPRPLPPLELRPPLTAHIVKAAWLRRTRELDTFAETADADALVFIDPAELFEAGQLKSPPDDYNGYCLIADLGGEAFGFIDLELTAPAGTVVDISHGEHLDDGKVRMFVGGRHFTDRYRCRDGRQSFQLPFRRVGCRYLQLNIANLCGPIRIHRIGLTPHEAVRPAAGSFNCADRNYLKLRELSVRTLELCMHEHYEDCPWREQSLYAYDSRNQALYGYYVWGNYHYAATSFTILGRTVGDDGLLNLCAPSMRTLTIPCFSFVWVAAILENVLFSGCFQLFRRFDRQIAFMISKALSGYCESNQLYHPGSEPQTWHFYEWAPELFPFGSCRADEFHALYNLYLCEMLESYARLLELDRQPERAERYRKILAALRRAIDRAFWVEERQCYATKLIGGKPSDLGHDHTQFLALWTRTAPPEKVPAVLDTIYSGRLTPVTLSALPYLCRVMFSGGPEGRRYVGRKLQEYFDGMLQREATSLWETTVGGDDFEQAGSLCHGWSALPVYFYHAGILGVTPLEPGFRRFQVSPYGDRLDAAEGTVPTPEGFIRIAWRRDGETLALEIEHPPALTPVVVPLPECPVGSLTINGAAVDRASAVMP